MHVACVGTRCPGEQLGRGGMIAPRYLFPMQHFPRRVTNIADPKAEALSSSLFQRRGSQPRRWPSCMETLERCILHCRSCRLAEMRTLRPIGGLHRESVFVTKVPAGWEAGFGDMGHTSRLSCLVPHRKLG